MLKLQVLQRDYIFCWVFSYLEQFPELFLHQKYSWVPRNSLGRGSLLVLPSVYYVGCGAPPNALVAVNTLKYCTWHDKGSPFCFIQVTQ